MSGSTVTWNNELIFQLIDLYKERKFLWDTSMVEYKDRIKKNEAWCEIAKCLGMDKEAVERKIKILLTQFRREVIKLGDDSRWFAYNKLLFMKPRVERLLHLQQNSGQSVSVSDYEVFIANASSIKNEGSDDDGDDQSTSRSSRKRSWSPEEVDPIPTTLDKSEEVYKMVKEMHSDRCVKDEFTVFGEHVAAKLRRITNLYAKCTAQYHINNILYKAEIGEYDDVRP